MKDKELYAFMLYLLTNEFEEKRLISIIKQIYKLDKKVGSDNND